MRFRRGGYWRVAKDCATNGSTRGKGLRTWEFTGAERLPRSAWRDMSEDIRAPRFAQGGLKGALAGVSPEGFSRVLGPGMD
eukprot:1180256-Pyramimonas_sp.AAC.1